MKRASKIIFVLLFALSIIFMGVPRAKAETSTLYSNGYRYNYHTNLNPGYDFEYQITEKIGYICENIVEPSGFEQRGGGELNAYIPYYYVMKNPNNNTYVFFDSVYIYFSKLYENNQVTYEDINILFGKSNDTQLGLGSIRYNGLYDNCTAISLNLDIYVPLLGQYDSIYWLVEYGYLGAYSTTDYLSLLSNADISSNNDLVDTIAFNNGVASVLARPQDYQLYTYSQLESARDLAYQNGLNASSTDLSEYSNVVSTTFQGFASILNTQVFPHITIGLIIGLPILLGLFLIIIKLIRG